MSATRNLFSGHFFEAFEDFHRNAKDDGVVGTVAGVFDGLEGAKGDSAGGRQGFHGFTKIDGGGQFTFSPDDGGAAFTFGLGLFGHDLLHIIGNGDVLKTDTGDINAPVNSFGINDLLDLIADLLAIGQQLVQFDTADHIAESSLSVLGDSIGKITDFEDGIFGFFNLEVNNTVDTNGNIIFGDNALLGNINGVDPDIDFDDPLENRNDDFKAGIESVGVGAEGQDDTAFILIDNNDGLEKKINNNKNDE